MACLPKVLVFQRYHAPLLVVANLVGVGTVVIPVFSKCSAILASVSLGLLSELLESGW